MVETTAKHCPMCGSTLVPYPLSTAPDCGDQLYKIRCSLGTLWLDVLNKSSYPITFINPQSQKLIVRPPGMVNKNSCMAGDFKSQGIWLNDSLPFNITASNTIIGMNCSTEVLELAMNCSSSGICHEYVGGNALAKAACGNTTICCSYTTGGSKNAYRIRIRPQRCTAYVSFVNLDVSLPVNKWPEPGLEIVWTLPPEPGCNVQVDCKDLANSVCLVEKDVQKRCVCKAGFQWDPINGICQHLKCLHKRGYKKPKNKTALTGGTVVAIGVMLIGALMSVIVYKRRERIQKETQRSISKIREDMLNANNSGKTARIFSGKEVTKATNNFSKENLLGSGGFGEVFKGTLDDGSFIAVKRAKVGNTKGLDQLINEVRILCQVNHRSLVRLLGCCVELDQPLLIYEYISNGTLFEHLHSNHSGKWEPLNWSMRLNIAYQTAEGLSYLHNSVVPRIYHRDIKSSNILLDEKLNPKVSDFGLSRLVVSETTHITTCAQGTLGYLDPEYYMNFQLSDKSDVYSFGVVLLELLISEKVIDFNREEQDVNLVVYAKKVMREDRFMDVIDPVLKERATELGLETLKAMASLAAACLDEQKNNRPTMKEVTDEIEYIISILKK